MPLGLGVRFLLRKRQICARRCSWVSLVGSMIGGIVGTAAGAGAAAAGAAAISGAACAIASSADSGHPDADSMVHVLGCIFSCF